MFASDLDPLSTHRPNRAMRLSMPVPRAAMCVCVELQFRWQLGSEISRCSDASSYMIQDWRLAERVLHSVQPA